MLGSLLKNMTFMLVETQIVYPDGYEGEQINISSDIDLVSAVPFPVIVGLSALLAAICVGLIVIILLQKKRASGIGAALAGSGETYWSKNKGKSVEGSLEKYTKWGGAAFILVALLINVLM